jgi:large subunit ribosomal protein L22
MVKELEIEDALDQLEFLNKRGAKYVQKALKSASANAKNQANLKMNELKIAEMFVTEAMTYKRGKPVARGRYHMIRRRGSNLTVKLTQAIQ